MLASVEVTAQMSVFVSMYNCRYLLSFYFNDSKGKILDLQIVLLKKNTYRSLFNVGTLNAVLYGSHISPILFHVFFPCINHKH